jgi:hypothetical protein
MAKIPPKAHACIAGLEQPCQATHQQIVELLVISKAIIQQPEFLQGPCLESTKRKFRKCSHERQLQSQHLNLGPHHIIQL